MVVHFYFVYQFLIFRITLPAVISDEHCQKVSVKLSDFHINSVLVSNIYFHINNLIC